MARRPPRPTMPSPTHLMVLLPERLVGRERVRWRRTARPTALATRRSTSSDAGVGATDGRNPLASTGEPSTPEVATGTVANSTVTRVQTEALRPFIIRARPSIWGLHRELLQVGFEIRRGRAVGDRPPERRLRLRPHVSRPPSRRSPLRTHRTSQVVLVHSSVLSPWFAQQFRRVSEAIPSGSSAIPWRCANFGDRTPATHTRADVRPRSSHRAPLSMPARVGRVQSTPRNFPDPPTAPACRDCSASSRSAAVVPAAASATSVSPPSHPRSGPQTAAAAVATSLPSAAATVRADCSGTHPGPPAPNDAPTVDTSRSKATGSKSTSTSRSQPCAAAHAPTLGQLHTGRQVLHEVCLPAHPISAAGARRRPDLTRRRPRLPGSVAIANVLTIRSRHESASHALLPTATTVHNVAIHSARRRPPPVSDIGISTAAAYT